MNAAEFQRMIEAAHPAKDEAERRERHTRAAHLLTEMRRAGYRATPPLQRLFRRALNNLFALPDEDAARLVLALLRANERIAHMNRSFGASFRRRSRKGGAR